MPSTEWGKWAGRSANLTRRGAGHRMGILTATSEQQDTQHRPGLLSKATRCLRHFINIKGEWRLGLVPPGMGEVLAKA